MAEVVGTAFVRIRAITAQLSKDIEDGIKKGSADADVDRLGDDTGNTFSKGFAKKVKSELGEAVSDALDSRDVDVDDEGIGIGSRLANAVREGFERSNRPGGPIQRAINRVSERMGSGGGTSFAGGFRGAVLRGFIALSPALVAPLAGVVSLITQYILALVSQIGFLVTAAVGGGVAMAAAFGGVGLALIPVISAFKAETPALKRFTTNLEKFKKAWVEVGAAAQTQLLPAVGHLFWVLENHVIPQFKNFSEVVGNLSGDFVTVVSNMLVTERTQTRLSNIFAGSINIFESFTIGIGHLVEIFLALFSEAMPIAIQFGDALEDLVARWRMLIVSREQTGELGATLQLWYDRASQFASALGDVFVALWETFKIGADVAQPFFDTFSEFAQNWRDFTQSTEGQNRIRDVFENARAVAHEFNALVTDIFDRLFGAAIDGDNNNLIRVLRTIREDFIPAIDDFLTRFAQQSGDALTELAVSLGELFRTMSDTGALSITAQILSGIAKALSLILSIPGVDRLIGLFLGIAGAFRILSFLRIPQMLSGIVTALEGLFGVAIGGPLAALAAALAVLGGWIAFVKDRWGELTSAIPLFTGPLGIAGFVIGGIIANFERLKDVLGTVAGFLGDVGGAIADAVGGALSDVLGFLGGVGSTIVDGVGTGIDFLWNDILVPFGRFLSGSFSSAWDGVVSAFDYITDTVLPAIGDAFGWVQDEILEPFGDWLAEVFAPVWDALVDVWRDDVSPILEDIGNLFNGLYQDVLLPFGRWLSDTFSPVWQAISTVLGTLKTGVLEPLASFITGDFANAWNTFYNNILRPIADFIILVFANAWNGLVTVWTTTVKPALDTLIAGFTWLWQNVLVPVWNFLSAVFTPVLKVLGQILLTIVGVAVQVVGGIFLWFFNNVLAPVWGFISANFIPIITMLAVTFTTILAGGIRLAGDVLNIVYNGIIIPVANFLRSTFVGAINAATGAWGAFRSGVQQVWNVLNSLYHGIIVPIAGFLRDAFVSGINIATSAWRGFLSVIQSIVGALKSAWDWVQKLIDAIPDIPSLPDLPSFSFDPGGLNPFAAGGIITRPTAALVGEAGKEVIIPLTRPQRARDLAEQSGLLDILLGRGVNRFGGGSSVTIGENAINITFTGAVPTDAEARKVGEQIIVGMNGVLARRRLQSGTRTT